MRLIALLLLGSSLAVAEPWDIPPPPRGLWVVDQTGKVSSSTVSQLNAIAAGVDGSGAGQLGVLVTRTTSGLKPRDFATGVFNSWGVGHHGTNDGILLFVAVDDRKAEIILGDGSKVTSSQTDAVMSNQLVANMKRGSLDDALMESASALAGHMRRAAGVAATPHENDNTGIGPDAYTIPGIDRPMLDEKLSPFAEGAAPFPDRSPRSWVIDLSDALTPSQRAQLDVAASDVYASNEGRIFFLVTRSAAPYPSPSDLAKRLHRQVGPLSGLPMAVVTVDLVENRGEIVLAEGFSLGSWERNQLWKAENGLREGLRKDPIVAMKDAQVFAQLALTQKIPPRGLDDVVTEGISRNAQVFQFGGVGLLIGAAFAARRWNRKRVRSCEKCQQPRLLLDDSSEDAHLTSAQTTEESIRSVDYDVWWCERCHDPLILRYGRWFSGYSSCPECNAKTKSSTSTTLSRATEYSSGSERIDERCANCSFSNSYTRTIPRITRSSSSSSSSSWSSSSRSSSSFGGGSSSGRGSSGSW